MQTPQQIWKSCCEASVEIRARYSLKSAIDYLVGEKLMMFAQTGESHPEFLAELPAFSKNIDPAPARDLWQLSGINLSGD